MTSIERPYMLTKVKKLKGYKLECLDGEIGKAEEFYFNDQTWAIRYLVVDTGLWIIRRQLLISPKSLLGVDLEKQHIIVKLTKKQIEDCPASSSDKPVSRHFEEDFFVSLGVPLDWDNQGQGPDVWDPHLRSTHDVCGHRLHAEDRDIGHVDDFIVDAASWTIRYLVIETGDWWPEKKVLISPEWIERISWNQGKVFVNVSSTTIKLSPEYSEDALLSRDYETKLHSHYGRNGYWTDNPTRQ